MYMFCAGEREFSMRIQKGKKGRNAVSVFAARKAGGAVRIGIFGLHPNAGATFVSLLLAEYLTGVRGEQTAVVERGGHNELRNLSGHFNVKNRSKSERTTLHGITLLSMEEDREYIDCLNKTDSCMIYDLGCCYPMARERMKHCDLLIFVFHLCDWKFSEEKLTIELTALMKKEEQIYQKAHLLGNLMSQSKGRAERIRSKNISFLGYEPDVYVPSVQARSLFDSLLSDFSTMVRD